MKYSCSECRTNLDNGLYIKNSCCRDFIYKNHNRIFRKEERDILSKALPGGYVIIDSLLVDTLGTYIHAKNNDGSYLILDVNDAFIQDRHLCIFLLSDFAYFLTKLDNNFLQYREYIINEAHILLFYSFPEDFKSLKNLNPDNDIALVNRILSKGLKAICQTDIIIPGQFTSFDVLNPRRIFINKKNASLFLFPVFHEDFLKYNEYDEMSHQLSIFENILEQYPSYNRNRNNLLEIFNLGWNLYTLITQRAPEFDQVLESRDSFPIRPSKLNNNCTDYIEEIILRSLLYPNAVPFGNINEIYTFLSKIYNYRIKLRSGSKDTAIMLSLAKYYESVSLYSPKKNRWMGLAYDIYQKLSNENPKDTEISYQKANIMFKTGKYNHAKTILDKIVEDDPKNVQAFLLLGYLYLEGYNNIEESMKCYEKLESLLSRVPDAIMMLKGDIFLKKGDFQKARDIFYRIYESKDINQSIKRKAKLRLTKIII